MEKNIQFQIYECLGGRTITSKTKINVFYLKKSRPLAVCMYVFVSGIVEPGYKLLCDLIPRGIFMVTFRKGCLDMHHARSQFLNSWCLNFIYGPTPKFAFLRPKLRPITLFVFNEYFKNCFVQHWLVRPLPGWARKSCKHYNYL